MQNCQEEDTARKYSAKLLDHDDYDVETQNDGEGIVERMKRIRSHRMIGLVL